MVVPRDEASVLGGLRSEIAMQSKSHPPPCPWHSSGTDQKEKVMPLNLTRSLLVVLIPGGIALFPWVLWLLDSNERVATFYKAYPELSWAVLFAAAAVAGTLFESINSYIEDYWDRRRENDWEVSKNWYDYLARVCPTAPVAHGYLGRLVTTMYFELAMMWATFIFVMGLVPLLRLPINPDWPTVISLWPYLLGSFLGGVASAFFHKGARDSHLVLCKTRKEINQRLRYLDGPATATT
jgi:hypothetical protein